MRFAVGFSVTVAVVGFIAITWMGYLEREAVRLYDYVNSRIEAAKNEVQ